MSITTCCIVYLYKKNPGDKFPLLFIFKKLFEISQICW